MHKSVKKLGDVSCSTLTGEILILSSHGGHAALLPAWLVTGGGGWMVGIAQSCPTMPPSFSYWASRDAHTNQPCRSLTQAETHQILVSRKINYIAIPKHLRHKDKCGSICIVEAGTKAYSTCLRLRPCSVSDTVQAANKTHRTMRTLCCETTRPQSFVNYSSINMTLMFLQRLSPLICDSSQSTHRFIAIRR